MDSAKIDQIIKEHRGRSGDLIHVLMEIQHQNHWLPRDVLHQVAEALGAKKLVLHSLPDNRFDTVPLLDLVKLVEQEIGRVQPEVIFTHHAGDLNQDHATLHRAVLTATRPAPDQVVRTIFTFEVPSSTDWAFGQFQRAFQPNVFIDIHETLETKIQLMERYESEARRFPHPRSPEALRTIARRWGTVAGLPAAEAFELIRDVR